MIDEAIVGELFSYFKEDYGFKIGNATKLFDAERNLLEFLVKIGRKMENKFFEEIGPEYLGNIIEKMVSSTSSKTTERNQSMDCLEG